MVDHTKIQVDCTCNTIWLYMYMSEVCCVLTEAVEVRDCTPRHPAPGDVSGPEGAIISHCTTHTHTHIVIQLVNISQLKLSKTSKEPQ